MSHAIGVTVMIFFMVVLHEFGHFLAAKLQGKKVKEVTLGLPLTEIIFGKKISTIFYEFEYKGVKIGLSWLIFGGSVEFENFDDATLGEKIVFFLAGPLMNFVIAMVPMIIFYGFYQSFDLAGMILRGTLEVLGLLTVGSLPMSQIMGPVGAVVYLAEVSRAYGPLFVWMFLNLSVMTFNLIPFPVLDGGQVVTAVLVSYLGPKAEKPAKIIGKIAYYMLIILVVLSMTKDLW